ncbi:MAG: DUF4012 domain-containing protein [Ktedonobacterales bacterium]
MSKRTSKRIWERLLPAANAVLLARIFFCLIILVNLAAGSAIWLIKAQMVAKSASEDLPARLARIETLMAQSNLLQPGLLEQLATELAATQQDISSLQSTVSVIGELGIGSSGDWVHALRLGLEMVQSGEDLVAAARVVQPDLAGYANSILDGPSGVLRARGTHPIISDIETAQQDITQAIQIWQQALSEWGSFSGGVPSLPSPAMNTIVRAMGSLAQTVTVALAATSALLDDSNNLLGLKSPENILFIEENPDVLRPTGGVITHYAVLTFAQGVLSSNIQLHSLSALDCLQQVCADSTLPPVDNWMPVSHAPVQLGDANLDPDLTISGWSIYNHFEEEGGPRVGGIIVATQNVFADILTAIGPITIQGLPGTFTAGNVVERMRSVRASGTLVGDIDALMLDAITTKLKSLTPEQETALGHALLQALLTKDLQLFSTNASVQDSLMEMNVAGEVVSPSGDSLEIVDTNVSGVPVNPFITETATENIMLDAHGGAQHELSLTYHYIVPADTLPPPTYTDVVRVIVPNPAVGQNISGPCASLQISEEFHQALACELTVAPGATVTIGFSWQVPRVALLPGAAPHSYTVVLQRQPGADVDIHVSIRAPSGQSLSVATGPGRLASGQLTFAAAPLLTDTTLQAFFH